METASEMGQSPAGRFTCPLGGIIIPCKKDRKSCSEMFSEYGKSGFKRLFGRTFDGFFHFIEDPLQTVCHDCIEHSDGKRRRGRCANSAEFKLIARKDKERGAVPIVWICNMQ